MGDGVRPSLLGDLHQTPSNQGSGDAGAKQVLPFVQGVGAEHEEGVVPCKLPRQVLDVNLPHPHRLGPGQCHLLPLADVSGEGDHLSPVGFLQPAADDGGIQPAEAGQYYFLQHGIKPSIAPTKRDLQRPRLIPRRKASDPAHRPATGGAQPISPKPPFVAAPGQALTD